VFAIARSLEAKIGEIKLVDGDLAGLQLGKLTGDGEARWIGDRRKEHHQHAENDKGRDKITALEVLEPRPAA